jgi:hypothetical protein
MKIAISISAYTNSPASLELTKQCIRNIKQNTDFFVICTNHLPGDSELAEMCDLYLYEKNNVLTTHTFYEHSWLTTADFRFDLRLKKSKNNIYHGPAVHQNIYNGVSLGKMIGADFVICMNFDVLLSPNEFLKVKNCVDSLQQQSKSAFFLKSIEQEGLHLKTVFFITNPDFYLSHVNPISNEDDYNALLEITNAPSNGLENMYYHAFEPYLDGCIVVESNETDFFPEGANFTNSQAEYYAVLPILSQGQHSNTAGVACTFSNKNDDRTLYYEVYENDILILSGQYKIQSAGWFIDRFKMNDIGIYKTIFKIEGAGNTTTKTLEYMGYQDILDAGSVNYFL